MCGTLKRLVWYCEEGGVVRGWYGTLRKVAQWRGTLKKVVWYFDEGGILL